MVVRNVVRSPVRAVVQSVFGEGESFHPFQLFRSGAQGAWYDPSDFSTLYQDAAGTTPVTAVEQPVRLMLDRSKGLVLGSEAVSNPGGPYTATTGWVAGFNVTTSTLTVGSGLLTLTANGTDAAPRFVIPITGLTSGRSYRIRLTGLAATGTGDRYGVWTSSSSGTGGTVFNQVVAANWGAVDPVELLLTATATTMYLAVGMAGTPTAGSTLSIASASVRELPGNHAVAPNDASRPVLRARYNQLTFSEQFDNAAWIGARVGGVEGPTVTANAAAAPDGTTTADEINYTSSTGMFLGQIVPFTAAATGTITVWAYVPGTGGAPSIRITTNNTSAWNTGISQSFALTTGLQRLTLTGVLISSGSSCRVMFGGANANGTADTAVTGKVYLWGAQLLTAADHAATGGAYQRIGSATDYDTGPPWRPYLAFDGSDDSMSTSSIDFSGTDEMTVFAGVTKLSDAAGGTIVGFGNVTSENGTFELRGPRSAAANYMFASRGTAIADANAGTFAAPVTNVVAGVGDISADICILRVQGTQVASVATDQGTGNYGTRALNIGRLGGVSLPFNGRLYSALVLGRTATAPELTAMETWIAGKTGVSL